MKLLSEHLMNKKAPQLMCIFLDQNRLYCTFSCMKIVEAIPPIPYDKTSTLSKPPTINICLVTNTTSFFTFCEQITQIAKVMSIIFWAIGIYWHIGTFRSKLYYAIYIHILYIKWSFPNFSLKLRTAGSMIGSDLSVLVSSVTVNFTEDACLALTAQNEPCSISKSFDPMVTKVRKRIKKLELFSNIPPIDTN